MRLPWVYRKNSSSNQENTINLEASTVMPMKKRKIESGTNEAVVDLLLESAMNKISVFLS
ncbi:hypothetical protein EZS27_008796 [termite gut metagenome]|uniref:Uncharacterized protein n=1 Tax=termite gut metagenome TaxID=433724 RepID=A0A5J4SCR9_9ZZZZ